MNLLNVIENGQLKTYHLDDKPVWEIGRPSENIHPDIRILSTDASNKHGRIENMDGFWFYLDYNGKSGTVYNGKRITAGISGRIKPVILSDGDILIIDGRQNQNYKDAAWAIFTTHYHGDDWRKVDIKDLKDLSVSIGEEIIYLKNPIKGSVVVRDTGMAIYIGAHLFLIGDMRLLV